MGHQVIPAAVLGYEGSEFRILNGYLFDSWPYFQNFMQFFSGLFLSQLKGFVLLSRVQIILGLLYQAKKGSFSRIRDV